jgi:anti-sigma B factor antagonist
MATYLQIEDLALDDQTQLIAVEGQIDLYSAPEFKERTMRAIEQGKRRLVIDLSEVSFLDSTALSVLVGALRRLRPFGGAIAIVSAEPDVRRLFEITGLETTLPICASREDALQTVAAVADF